MGDCFDLGKVAYLEADYYHTELWMVQALNQLDQGETSSTVDGVTILDYLSYSVYQQGELERALQFTTRLLDLGQRHGGRTVPQTQTCRTLMSDSSAL